MCLKVNFKGPVTDDFLIDYAPILLIIYEHVCIVLCSIFHVVVRNPLFHGVPE